MEQAPEQNNLFGLNVDDPIRNHLFETAKWGRFLAIVGFVICGLIVVAGIFAATSFNDLSSGGYRGRYDMYDESAGLGAIGPMVLVICIIVATLYFFPSLFLLRFSNRMKTALASDNQELLASSFQNLKIVFRYTGIMSIVFIVLYVLGQIGRAMGS
ncbi:MAG TPA: DUF5362 family protein [Chitinophagaceae bacterium]